MIPGDLRTFKENLVVKLQSSIGLVNEILRKRNAYYRESLANFFMTPACSSVYSM